MKKYLALLCAALMFMCVLCGCGKEAPAEDGTASPGESSADGTDMYPVLEQEEIDNVENQPNSTVTEEKIRGTYWKSVRFEGEGSAEGGDEMPLGSWNADLFLNEDGTGRFRNTYGASYSYFQPECTWSFDKGTSRLLLELSDGTETYFHGLFSENGLCIDYYGGELWFEQAEMPTAGAQWCLADLVGTWKLESVETEGYAFPGDENGMHGSVSFFFDDPALTANYVQSDDFGNRTEAVDAMVVYMDMALFDGCANEAWCVELIDDDDSLRLYAALTCRDELVILVEQYFDDFEYPAVSVQQFSWQGTGAVG